ncbi:hypothetical protein GOBAR_AA04053 [Gossypium barbadense]|uniref:Uncharacterized protein n=1 Tax=Gossypium barbadense TaxID=3634 RepID=A0A2P5YLP3_GOSBA|nr:hypothetical protein GOBAR_AA04053 [Gossypium barbadense]
MMRVKEDTLVVVVVRFHKCCAKRILFLKLAMVVVEQGMTVMENLSQWSFKFLSNRKLRHTAVRHARVPSFHPVRFMVLEIGRNGALGHVARLCQSSFASLTPIFAHGHAARPWQLIASRVGGNFALFSHGLRHARVPGRVCFRKPAFHESVSMLDVKTKI